MNRGIYTAATGMRATQEYLEVITNNLANVGTTAFKRDEVNFAEAYLRTLRANGGKGPIIGQFQSGPKNLGTLTNFTRGETLRTGNPLDVAISTNEGMFAVKTPRGIFYTRDGNFRLDLEGTLVNKDGYPVLDKNLTPIVAEKRDTARIDENGMLQIANQTAGTIGLFKGEFKKAGNNLYTGENTSALDNTQLLTGAIEGSNVNAVSVMIEMIAVQRIYEMAQRSIQQNDESSQRLIETSQRG